jgi:hypothetical protein
MALVAAGAAGGGTATRTYDKVWQCSRGCAFTSADFDDVLMHERSAHDWPRLEQQSRASRSRAAESAREVEWGNLMAGAAGILTFRKVRDSLRTLGLCVFPYSSCEMMRLAIH